MTHVTGEEGEGEERRRGGEEKGRRGRGGEGERRRRGGEEKGRGGEGEGRRRGGEEKGRGGEGEGRRRGGEEETGRRGRVNIRVIWDMRGCHGEQAWLP